MGSYSTAIEMAFAASLLLGTWAALYRALADRYTELVREVERLQKIDVLKSQLILEDLPETLSREHRRWRWWWWGGLGSCVITALGIYIVAWVVDPNEEAGWWVWLIFSAPFLGLICMIRMFYLGTQSNKNARNIADRLRNKGDELEEEGRAVTQAARQAKPDDSE